MLKNGWSFDCKKYKLEALYEQNQNAIQRLKLPVEKFNVGNFSAWKISCEKFLDEFKTEDSFSFFDFKLEIISQRSFSEIFKNGFMKNISWCLIIWWTPT